MSLCKKCYIEPVEVRARKAGNCWDAWWECAGMRGGNVLQNACQKNGKLLGCVAGMCWDAWQECAAKCATLSLSKCVPENGKLLGCVVEILDGFFEIQTSMMQKACQKMFFISKC